jgi:hypothetical protein
MWADSREAHFHSYGPSLGIVSKDERSSRLVEMTKSSNTVSMSIN